MVANGAARVSDGVVRVSVGTERVSDDAARVSDGAAGVSPDGCPSSAISASSCCKAKSLFFFVSSDSIFTSNSTISTP